jgi:hypothetical protein
VRQLRDLPELLMQTKRESMIEAHVNTWLGLVGSALITGGLNYLGAYLGWALWFTTLLSVAGCTVWSLLRGYHVRRFFNARQARQPYNGPYQLHATYTSDKNYENLELAACRLRVGVLPVGDEGNQPAAPGRPEDHASAS